MSHGGAGGLVFLSLKKAHDLTSWEDSRALTLNEMVDASSREELSP